MLNDEDYAINLRLFKRLRFYHIFDPNGTKIFGRNAYWLVFVAYTAFECCVLLFGVPGYFFGTDDRISEVALMLSMVMELQKLQDVWQACVYAYYANVVWEIIDVARLDFLTSKGCRMYASSLRENRTRFIRFTNWFCILSFSICIQWIMSPFVINLFGMYKYPDQRTENIMNLRFPVNVHTYNKYYFVFYAIETVSSIYGTAMLVMPDLFIISICQIIAFQYNVLSQTFESICGYEDTVRENCNEEYVNFKLVLSDLQRLYKMVKSFFFVIKSLVLLRVALMSLTIINMAISFIIISSSEESVSLLYAIKVGSSAIFGSLQLFIYCYLSNNINSARASVNFGIYSCNWTMMDIKFKKLLLLAMRMNDATQLTLKASPKKIIDLQLFANVMSTSYNIVSVMTKALKNRNA